MITTVLLHDGIFGITMPAGKDTTKTLILKNRRYEERKLYALNKDLVKALYGDKFSK